MLHAVSWDAADLDVLRLPNLQPQEALKTESAWNVEERRTSRRVIGLSRIRACCIISPDLISFIIQRRSAGGALAGAFVLQKLLTSWQPLFTIWSCDEPGILPTSRNTPLPGRDGYDGAVGVQNLIVHGSAL